ncbi:hypothetical protein PENTCL1PPCAC_4791 [Pristionchus entomophagus]|uniref:C2H2-type domain-containing protein n=1 Tax=Pristionchus entomophagus TaxID=358040 RepID=A0AAV5SGX1_9BILA|nr:hypothetical protein PENTCL1PPCAC_4791 [Pristionchus entomophagus]
MRFGLHSEYPIHNLEHFINQKHYRLSITRLLLWLQQLRHRPFRRRNHRLSGRCFNQSGLSCDIIETKRSMLAAVPVSNHVVHASRFECARCTDVNTRLTAEHLRMVLHVSHIIFNGGYFL